jgi:hypothetical protein
VREQDQAPQLDSLGEKTKSREGNNLVATTRPELVGDGQGTTVMVTATWSPWHRGRERSEGEREWFGLVQPNRFSQFDRGV